MFPGCNELTWRDRPRSSSALGYHTVIRLRLRRGADDETHIDLLVFEAILQGDTEKDVGLHRDDEVDERIVSAWHHSTTYAVGSRRKPWGIYARACSDRISPRSTSSAY